MHGRTVDWKPPVVSRWETFYSGLNQALTLLTKLIYLSLKITKLLVSAYQIISKGDEAC